MKVELERYLWLSVGLQAAGLILDGLLLAGGVSAARMVVPFSAAGLLVCLAAARLETLERQAREEQRDMTAGNADHSLFRADPEAAAPFSATQRLRQFERLGVPLVSPALVLIGGLGAVWLALTVRAGLTEQQGALPAGFLGVRAFVVFLLHRFLLVVSRRSDSAGVRAPAIWLGLTALASAIAAAVIMIAAWAEIALTVPVLAAAAIVSGLLALEALLMTIAGLYRSGPRRLPQSRLGALLCDPGAWAHDLAGVLDYQFGFRISETWLYRLLRRLALPLLLAQLALLYVSYCLVVIGPHEAAIVEVMGRPVPGSVLHAGTHWVLPPPWHRVRRYPMHRIQTLYVGFDQDGDDDNTHSRQHRHSQHAGYSKYKLWTEDHHHEEHDFLVAARELDGGPAEIAAVPVNLLSISMVIDYQVIDLLAYMTVHRDPEALLQQLVSRLLMLEALNADVFDLMGPGQQSLADRLAGRLGEAVREVNLGLEVRDVTLRGIHPPVAVAAAFEAVIGADDLYETAILEAETYRVRRLPSAHAEAYARRRAAAADRAARLVKVEAEIELFVRQAEAAAQAPAVYRLRSLMEVIETALPRVSRRLVIAVTDSEEIEFDAVDKFYADLLDAAGRAATPVDP